MKLKVGIYYFCKSDCKKEWLSSQHVDPNDPRNLNVQSFLKKHTSIVLPKESFSVQANLDELVLDVFSLTTFKINEVGSF